MAFAPYFRPYFGALAISLIKIAIFGNKLANFLFIIFYWYISETIFENRLKKMDLHSIITNFSIIFGIYQFGLAGIFYGPLIIIILRCVQR
jgi:predicted PurR-regulated permease PerM